ncbi:MAG: hypothetical protein B7Z16_11555, partial [Algoriphagus sp. 32-45-6]
KQKCQPDEYQPKTCQNGIGNHKNCIPNETEYMVKEELELIHCGILAHKGTPLVIESQNSTFNTK